MKIYVASSWRNDRQPAVVEVLREAGHEVYDFRHPAPGNNGFSWSEIDQNWKNWSPAAFRAALRHPVAQNGYAHDFNAMQWANVCVLVMPCGRSAHLEAGYMAGQGKPVYVLLADGEPELMYLLCGGPMNLVVSLDELQNRLDTMEYYRRTWKAEFPDA